MQQPCGEIMIASFGSAKIGAHLSDLRRHGFCQAWSVLTGVKLASLPVVMRHLEDGKQVALGVAAYG